MNFLAALRARFEPALKSLAENPAPYLAMIRPAQDLRFGDYQANCVMPLANQLRRKPRELAEEILRQVDVSGLCHPPEIAGPGFINLKLRDDVIARETAAIAHDDRLGIPLSPNPRTIVIDFSGPNIAKPMHVGHLRSTVLGDALQRLYRFLGHRVIGDNHLGDWGTQFGMIIYGYKHFLDREAFGRDEVAELARLYRLVNQLSDYFEVLEGLPGLDAQLAAKDFEVRTAEQASADGKHKEAAKQLKKLRVELAELREQIAVAHKKREAVETSPLLKPMAESHPTIGEDARRETARLHAGDVENQQLWHRFLPSCLAALQKVYDRLGVRFDLTLGESHYQPLLAGVVQEVLSKGLAEESDGAICIFLDGFDAPFLIRKSDGAYTYGTTDLATIRDRIDRLHAEEILYVVDARQADHFQMLFQAAKRWGYGETALRHVNFGSILGEDKRPFKTRSGDTVGLESLIDEAVAQARRIVETTDNEKKDGPELDEAARHRVAEAVGIGGIKYADLRHNRESDYVFSWEKMLAKTGDTATYIQYSIARVHGIFRRSGIVAKDWGEARKEVAVSLGTPEERALALCLNRLAEAIEAAAEDSRPNLITQHLFETANALSTFYEKVTVLKEPDAALRASRLLLCELTGKVLTFGLSILGIDICEQM